MDCRIWFTLIIWEINPRTRWGCQINKKTNIIDFHADDIYNLLELKDTTRNCLLTLASTRSCVPMLTTVHPIAFAELRQRVWFSFLSHGFSTLLVLIARSSIVPGTATLMSLLHKIIKWISNNTSIMLVCIHVWTNVWMSLCIFHIAKDY